MGGERRMVKTVSVKAASQSRTGWCMLVMKVQTKFQIHIMWKKYSGDITFYSNVDKKCNSKPAFGQIIDCEFMRAANDRGEIQEYLQFRNQDNQLIKCNLNIMNMLMKDSHEFNRAVTKLRMDGKVELLASYIRLLSTSAGFGGHNEGTNTNLGFRLDGSGITEANLGEKGGSLEELKQLMSDAKACAFDFLKENSKTKGAVQPNTVGRKRKMTDFFLNESLSKPPKMTKAEVCVKDFEDECNDADGVEKALTSGFFGKVDIRLSNLSASPKLALPVNLSKVRNIAQSMKSRFDPSQCVLTVCQVGQSNNTDSDLHQYHVVHGVHRLLALQKIEKEEPNGISDLVGLVDKRICCFIVKCSGSAVIQNYAQIRGNDIASKHKSEPRVHELIFIYKHLIDHHCHVAEASLVVERYAKLLLVSKDILTSLKKILQWPSQGLDKLAEVLHKFDTYGWTLPVKEMRRD